jgi:hypothetical protein
MKYARGKVVQIKLMSGEEIICTFCEDKDSTVDAFHINYVLQMIPYGDLDPYEETESYILRPFVTYTEDLATDVQLNPISVVFVAAPSEPILHQYQRSVDEIQSKLVGKMDTPTEEPEVANILSFPSRKQLLTEDDSGLQ